MVRIRTNAEHNREELNTAYIESHAGVLRYLDEIHALIHDMCAPESDRLDWAEVGSMNKVKSDLQHILNFLTGDEA